MNKTDLKEKIPLINNSNKGLRLVGYGVYGIIGVFILVVMMLLSDYSF